MEINHERLKIRDLKNGYSDDGEGGVRALGGALDVRPPYQREFVYRDKQRDAVIDTVMAGFPLNVMYFAVRGDGTFEVMDGQQRIISICQYVNGDYSHNQKSFGNLPKDIQESILEYELLVYYCEGTPSEKLEWFKTINIAGEKLTDQEIRNAVYHGTFVSDAKRWFSKSSGPAKSVGDGYVSGTPIRQELLELALKWVCLRDGLKEIEEYMDKRAADPNATDLWTYYQTVITWAKSTFPKPRKFLTSVKWGELYKRHGSTFPNAEELELRVASLMMDDEVTNKAGIYSFVLDGDERALNLRSFTDKQKTEVFERQSGQCANPSLSGHDGSKIFSFEAMEGDHITPWSQGGQTNIENCQMLCIDCNRRKGAR